LGVPDDIGRVQGISAVKKVKNHCFIMFCGLLFKINHDGDDDDDNDDDDDDDE